MSYSMKKHLQSKGLITLLMLFIGVNLSLSQTITGQVTDENNEALIGASVIVKSTANGVITDIDGRFQIEASPSDELIVSYIGYATKTVAVGNTTNVQISLLPDSQSIDDVVVVGYGTQKKSSFTGSTSKVKGEALEDLPSTRVDDALVGQLSGVNVQAVDGEIGSAPSITVRGVGSLNADGSPLIVVDGVIVDNDFLTNLDMNDVASFEVLKDASSAAIYGSQGANGVIMITLKAGEEGKTRISYNGNYGWRNAHHSDAYTFSLTDWANREMEANGSLSDKTIYKQLIGIDRPWQDEIFDGGNVVNQSISARGGNDKTKYLASFNFSDDDGVLLTDQFKKLGARLKLNTQLSDKLKLDVSFSPTYSKRRRFDGSTHDILRQTNWLPIVHDANTIQYVNPFKYPDVKIGDYAFQRHFDDYDLTAGNPIASGGTDISNTSNTNPAAKVLERERYDLKTKLFGSSMLSWQIINDLAFNTRIGVTYQDTERSRWQGTKSNRNGASAASMFESTQRQTRTIFDNFFTYNKLIDEHDINATFGFSMDEMQNNFSEVSGSGYTNDLVKEIANASIITGADAFAWERNRNSFFARANYNYAGKYLLSASIRRDGSSMFGADNKYGTFPAISAGWNVAEEDFLNQNDVLSALKLRISYGFTGNDVINIGSSDPDRSTGGTGLSTGNVLIDNYPSYSLLSAVTYVENGSVISGFAPANIANPEIQWERLKEINPGLDFSFLQNRFYGSVDYYVRTSDQLLLNNPVSNTTGFSSALVNLGKVENKGFEFEFRSRNISKEKFDWSSTIITTTNKNELLDFAESNGQITSIDSKRAAEWINLEGMPISTFYGWVVDREIPLEYIKNPWHPVGAQAQDVYVKDLNGDGLIDDDDKAPLGDPYPELIWSFTNNFNIGPVDLSFMFQGSHGAEVRNMGDQYIFNHFNSAQDFDPATTPDQGFIKQKIFTDAIIQDASYISLRNVNLGYRIPRTVLSRAGISGVKLYATGQNLWYSMADDYTGFNPESVDKTPQTNFGYQRAGSPIYKTISLGLNVDF